jgi:hypothetical protein
MSALPCCLLHVLNAYNRFHHAKMSHSCFKSASRLRVRSKIIIGRFILLSNFLIAISLFKSYLTRQSLRKSTNNLLCYYSYRHLFNIATVCFIKANTLKFALDLPPIGCRMARAWLQVNIRMNLNIIIHMNMNLPKLLSAIKLGTANIYTLNQNHVLFLISLNRQKRKTSR